MRSTPKQCIFNTFPRNFQFEVEVEVEVEVVVEVEEFVFEFQRIFFLDVKVQLGYYFHFSKSTTFGNGGCFSDLAISMYK